MPLLNRRIRAIYAGALGALGLAVGAAVDPLSSKSDEGQAAAAPITLRPARTSTPVERKIGSKPIEWWRARAVQNRRAINRLQREASQRATAASNQSSNSSSNQSSNSSRVWGYDFDPGSNVVDVYVGYLRKKLGKERIVNTRGMGYRFNVEPGPRRRRKR